MTGVQLFKTAPSLNQEENAKSAELTEDLTRVLSVGHAKPVVKKAIRHKQAEAGSGLHPANLEQIISGS